MPFGPEPLKDFLEESARYFRQVSGPGPFTADEVSADVPDYKWIGVAGPNIAQQCLDLGLLDEIRVELAPVILGAGIPFFANLAHTPVVLENPTVIEGDRVTHLVYPVRR